LGKAQAEPLPVPGAIGLEENLLLLTARTSKFVLAIPPGPTNRCAAVAMG